MRLHPDDTIAALSTASGPAERAVIRISGPNTASILASIFSPFSPKPGHWIKGHVRLSGLVSPLPAILHYFAAPRSYTGQDLVELHLVSSPPLVERLLADLFNAGARAAGPGEFTQRAFLAGKLDLTRAEAVQAVIDSGSDTDLQAALAQLAGNVSRPLDAIRGDLLDLLADVEAALDFADEDIEFVSPVETLSRITRALAELTNLQRQLDSRSTSTAPFRVALAGRPNAGKSSLFNALVGSEAAIVSPLAGTTRDYLRATISLAGLPVELLDTAGIGSPQSGIDAQAQDLAREAIQNADLVLHCVEAGTAPSMTIPGSLMVITKRDLGQVASGLAVSVVTSEGLAELRDAIMEQVRRRGSRGLAPSATRCRHHVDAAIECLRLAHSHCLNEQPAELLALDLRLALDHIGSLVGAVHTNELLDRIFSRFCIGK